MKKQCLINSMKDGFDISDEAKRECYFDWLYKNVINFQRVFCRNIKDFQA